MLIAPFIFLAGTPSQAAARQNEQLKGEADKTPIPLTLLPKDQYGSVDWAKAAKEGIIVPLATVEQGEKKKEKLFDNVVIMKSKKKGVSDVLFPHAPHTYWIICDSCHSSMFALKSGDTKGMSMKAIDEGEFCGRCHGKVAFRLDECERCHISGK
ncbi:MAG: hypothetical protein IME96_06295 [Proteobacteria bacterium]|nr:hypothetical protein [Pseudomonadota bacterium]